MFRALSSRQRESAYMRCASAVTPTARYGACETRLGTVVLVRVGREYSGIHGCYLRYSRVSMNTSACLCVLDGRARENAGFFWRTMQRGEGAGGESLVFWSALE
eukprot:6042430-Pleurochrysis_carterae.AAC.6